MKKYKDSLFFFHLKIVNIFYQYKFELKVVLLEYFIKITNRKNQCFSKIII